MKSLLILIMLTCSTTLYAQNIGTKYTIISYDDARLLEVFNSVAGDVDVGTEMVMDALDMHPTGFKFAILLLPDKKAIKYYIGREYRACYSLTNKTAYFSIEDLAFCVYVHETAHAIVDGHFANKVPLNKHELYAQYAEKQVLYPYKLRTFQPPNYIYW